MKCNYNKKNNRLYSVVLNFIFGIEFFWTVHILDNIRRKHRSGTGFEPPIF